MTDQNMTATEMMEIMAKEAKKHMSIGDVLHILRNPYGWSEDDTEKARLEACKLIESGQRQINRLHDTLSRAHWVAHQLECAAHPVPEVLSSANMLPSQPPQLFRTVSLPEDEYQCLINLREIIGTKLKEVFK